MNAARTIGVACPGKRDRIGGGERSAVKKSVPASTSTCARMNSFQVVVRLIHNSLKAPVITAALFKPFIEFSH